MHQLNKYPVFQWGSAEDDRHVHAQEQFRGISSTVVGGGPSTLLNKQLSWMGWMGSQGVLASGPRINKLMQSR